MVTIARMLTPQEQVNRREWVFVGLRYTLLAVLTLLLIVTPRQEFVLPYILFGIGLSFVLNLLVTISLVTRRGVTYLIPPTSFIDAALIVYLPLVSGGARSPLLPMVAVLIVAVAVRYSLRISMGLILLLVVLQVASAVVEAMQKTGVLDFPSLYLPLVYGISYAVMALWVSRLVRYERGHTKEVSEQVQRTKEAVEGFANLVSASANTENYQAVLEQTLALCLKNLVGRGRDLKKAAGFALLFAPDQNDRLHVGAHQNLPLPDQTLHALLVGGKIKTVIDSPDPLIVDDASTDPLLSKFTVVQECPVIALIPLRAAYTIYGIACIAVPRRLRESLQSNVKSYVSYGYQTAISIHNATLVTQLREERDRIVDNEEKARHDLARDLHDGPLNAVASLAMSLDFSRHLINSDIPAAKEELERMHKLASKTAREMRTAMYRLRPLALETAGLTTALEQYFNRLKEEYPSPKFFLDAPSFKDFESRLSTNAATLVFDIVKEAIGNVIKHAGAQRVTTTLRVKDQWLLFTISDDGKGFDVKKIEADYATRGSLGMTNMRERAELAGGDIHVASQIGRGTTVTGRVPLKSA